MKKFTYFALVIIIIIIIIKTIFKEEAPVTWFSVLKSKIRNTNVTDLKYKIYND